jgi:glycosyltransferase involved in cell wall biosynthesis
MKISFLVPAWNAERTLEKALNSIVAQRTDHEKEVIIIDDGSTDNTFGLAKKFAPMYPEVSVISKRNGGEASALNVGLQKVTGDFIAIIEADVELEPGWLNKILPWFDDPAVIGAGGTLVTSRDEPWIARIAGYEVERKFASKERYPRHITSANALYRSEAFKNAGMFNEKLVNASLDSDFNGRLIALGHKLAHVRDAMAFHYYKPTLIGYLARNYAYARYRFYVKNTFLYPSDRFLAINIILTGFAVCSLCLLGLSIRIPAVLFFLLILLQIPAAVQMFRCKKDAVLLAYPLVAVVKNIVAAVGLVVGMAYKIMR